MTEVAGFADELPKAELHLEGTLEPELKFERIDHGVNCLEDDALVARLARDGIGLTVCPISNRWVTDGLKAGELKTMLDRSLRATVNSDDPGPAYFGGYVNQNLVAAQQAAALTSAELAQLARNCFEIAWISRADRDRYLAELDAYVTQAPALGTHWVQVRTA